MSSMFDQEEKLLKLVVENTNCGLKKKESFLAIYNNEAYIKINQ